MPKSKEVKHYSFESAKEKGAFTKICKDMQQSEAWKKLSLRQQGLYLHLKSKFRIQTKIIFLFPKVKH